MAALVSRLWQAFNPPTPAKRSDALKFGILGAANIAPLALITPAKSHPEVVIQAVSARDRQKAEAFAKSNGIPEVRDSYQEILDDPNIDCVFIPLPNGLHFEWAVRAIRAGKHVLLEKPSVSNSTEAQILFNLPELSQPNGPVLLEAFHNRFYPSWALFQSLVDPADVVRVVSRSMIPWWASSKDDIYFNYPLSGGTMMATGTYNFAALRLLFGADPEECISCETKAYTDGIHDKCDYDFKAKFRFPNGGIGEASSTLRGETILKPSWVVVTTGEVVVPDGTLPAGQQKIQSRKLTLQGLVHGAFWHRIDVKEFNEIRSKDGKVVKKWEETRSHKAYTWREAGGEFADLPSEVYWMSYRHQLEQFVNKVRGRKTHHWVTGEDSIAQMKMLDMAYEKSGLGPRPTRPIGLGKMFDDMQDVAAQLVLKWDRFGPEHEIEVIDDMSRLTFDTIGLCAYGYRFNEFYSEEPHAFRKQLKEAIVESGRRANRPDLLNRFYYYKDEEHRQENIVKMRELCSKIIEEHINNPKPDAKDLLNVMIHGVDRETNETLGFQNVMYQIPTLLGGGYETTSSTLCFIYYFLCSNPEMLRKAQQEVDEIVGDKVLAYNMLRKLKYLDACMKEALRMQHPVSLLTRFSTRDTVLGGKYFIRKGQMVSGIWRHFHRDPKVWGEDADQFRPERMLDVNFQEMPPNSWKPFGDGLRACIGRGFAEQEILICMAMVLQKFDIEKVDPGYSLELTGQMGVKPVAFKIRVRRRAGRTLTVGIPGGVAQQQPKKAAESSVRSQREQQNGSDTAPKVKKPISVFFGGNQGTCESLAQSLSNSASEFGLDVVEITDLDAAVESLPTDRPSIIITPSYEGRPPYNAKRFVDWIEKMVSTGGKLPIGVKFTVFGAGNIDDKLEQLGAGRIFEPGFANVKRDLAGPWEAWSEKLCLSLSGSTKQKHPGRVGVDVRIERNRSNTALETDNMDIGVVVVNRELADASVGPSKRHVEVRLPKGCQYRSGDYLAVKGRNSDEIVSQVIKRFGLVAEDLMSIQSSNKDFFPSQPMAVEHFLRSSVELAAPITKRQLATLALWATESSTELTLLKKMQDDDTYQKLLDNRCSVIDILEDVPQLRIPFGVYVDLLLPLTPRLYSISSSPIESTNGSEDGLIASVTFDLIEAPSRSGHGMFRGMASSYLASRTPGDNVKCLVRPTRVPFQLPPNAETPIIMLAAGSGIAPMRTFIQERAAIRRKGAQKLGPALLFFGCRHPDKDYIYRSELKEWENEELVEVVPCFSRPSNGQKGRYVPDALWEQRQRVWDMFHNGAKVYVCGSAGRLGRSTAEIWRRIWMEMTGKCEAEAFEWFDRVKNDQYISDVY